MTATPVIQRALAELIGVYILVFAGTSAIVVDNFSGGAVTQLGIALVFGLVVTALIYTLATSPARISIRGQRGFWAAGRLSGREVAPYASLGAYDRIVLDAEKNLWVGDIQS